MKMKFLYKGFHLKQPKRIAEFVTKFSPKGRPYINGEVKYDISITKANIILRTRNLIKKIALTAARNRFENNEADKVRRRKPIRKLRFLDLMKS